MTLEILRFVTPLSLTLSHPPSLSLILSPSLFLSSCLPLLLLRTHAALFAGLWLRDSCGSHQPQILGCKRASSSRICPFSLAFLLSLSPFPYFAPSFPVSTLVSLPRLVVSDSSVARYCSGTPVMASNSIFDSFSNYSSTLLRGKPLSPPLHSISVFLFLPFLVSFCCVCCWRHL